MPAARRAPISDWAIEPLTMDAAARALGICRRTLTESLKTLPYYDQRGTKKVFYPEHIDALRNGLNKCALRSNGLTDGRSCTAPAQMASGSDALSKLAILAKQRKLGQR